MNWFMTVLRKYAVFEGRARRREYWFFVLFYILISIVLSMVDRVLGLYNEAYGMGALGGLFCLAVLIPSIAVGVRRLHDTGRTGWWPTRPSDSARRWWPARGSGRMASASSSTSAI